MNIKEIIKWLNSKTKNYCITNCNGICCDTGRYIITFSLDKVENLSKKYNIPIFDASNYTYFKFLQETKKNKKIPFPSFVLVENTAIIYNNNNKCPFYDNGCKIYYDRPIGCKEYPFYFDGEYLFIDGVCKLFKLEGIRKELEVLVNDEFEIVYI